MNQHRRLHAMNRRDFLKAGIGAAAGLTLGRTDLAARTGGKRETENKITVLGIDGIDAHLVRVLMDEGRLPAFKKLANLGGFRALQTSIPPQSPVAWSNFITGTNPGGHGIFDFVHRDPSNYLPTFSASSSEDAKHSLRIGNMVFPLSGGEIKNLRQGRAFWQILEDHDIPAVVFKIPSNYPPVPSRQRTLSGMGTPDIKGYYGLFNYYTNEYKDISEEVGGGGRIHEVYVIGNRVEAKIPGPTNTFKKDRPEAEVDFKVYIDPQNPVAKISYQGQEFILREKEWSGWKKIEFSLIPTQAVSGICMFYLKEVRPKFKLYVSPINIDPSSPALPITTPESYAKELSRKFGPFFTKGLPADTSALDNEVLDEEEFLQQDEMVLQESLAMYDYELGRFDSGLLFYYFSNADQRQHMFWRFVDEGHPSYDPLLAAKYGGIIEKTYVEMDKVVARTLDKIDRRTSLIVMSDHGFNPFRRGFNLNTWLKENGYHKLINEYKQDQSSFFENTDWSKSRAYGVGLNGLYINEKGREREGIVSTGSEKEHLVRELARRLEEVVDPKTGEKAILKAFVAKDVYQGPCLQNAPDIVLGFSRGYRISWSSPLGKFPKAVFEDNDQKWSGDHMSAPETLPGIVFADKPITAETPALYDLTATILSFFGIEKPEEMIGRSIF